MIQFKFRLKTITIITISLIKTSHQVIWWNSACIKYFLKPFFAYNMCHTKIQTLHFPSHVILWHDIKAKTKPKQTKNVTLIKNLSHYKYKTITTITHTKNKQQSNQITWITSKAAKLSYSPTNSNNSCDLLYIFLIINFLRISITQNIYFIFTAKNITKISCPIPIEAIKSKNMVSWFALGVAIISMPLNTLFIHSNQILIQNTKKF